MVIILAGVNDMTGHEVPTDSEGRGFQNYLGSGADLLTIFVVLV
jgi:hypothetical protein